MGVLGLERWSALRPEYSGSIFDADDYFIGGGPTELAWAAGFFDGEGCVSGWTDHKDRSWLQIVVVQTATTEHLERFKAAVGGVGTIGGPYQTPEGWADRYTWKSTGKQARRVIEVLRPYLCSPKLKKYDAGSWEI